MQSELWQQVQDIVIFNAPILIIGGFLVLLVLFLWLLTRNLRSWHSQIDKTGTALNEIAENVQQIKELLEIIETESTADKNGQPTCAQEEQTVNQPAEQVIINGSGRTPISVSIGQATTQVQSSEQKVKHVYPVNSAYSAYKEEPADFVDVSDEEPIRDDEPDSLIETGFSEIEPIEPVELEEREEAEDESWGLGFVEAEMTENEEYPEDNDLDAAAELEQGIKKKAGIYKDVECGRARNGRAYTREEIEACIKY